MTKLTPALIKAHEVKKLNGEHTRSSVFQVLKHLDQPVTSGEVKGLLEQTGKSVDQTYVHELLKKLTRDGLVSMRDETPAERQIRLNGRSNIGTGAHFTASYFWAGNGRSPKRTKHTDEIVSIKKTKKVRRPAKATKKQTGSPRETSLLARVAELEAQLARIQKILG